MVRVFWVHKILLFPYSQRSYIEASASSSRALTWSPIVSLLSKPSQATEEPNEAIAEPRPLVQEHPAGTPIGNISEEEHQDFAVSTQPHPIADP